MLEMLRPIWVGTGTVRERQYPVEVDVHLFHDGLGHNLISWVVHISKRNVECLNK